MKRWYWMPLVAGIALCGTFLSGCYEKRVIAEVWSPDRQHKAVVYAVLGGVTMDLNTNVSILPIPYGEPRLRPNVAAFTHGQTVSPEGPYWGPAITVRWITGSTLEVAYDPRAQVFKKASRVDGVRIVYRAEAQTGLPPAP